MSQQLSIDERQAQRRLMAEYDVDRATFLEALDASDLLLTDWETEFVGSYMQARSEGRWQNWFTPGRRVSADRMREHYAADLKLPSPVNFQTPGSPVSPKQCEAREGGCQYLVNNAGCPRNAPATSRPCARRAAGSGIARLTGTSPPKPADERRYRSQPRR